MSTRPLVSARMASAISLARRFIGCVTGRLFAYLYVNSAFCANAPIVGSARVPAAPARIWRREICMSCLRCNRWFSSCGAPSWGAAEIGFRDDCERSGGRGFPRLPQVCGFPQFAPGEELFADVLLGDLAVGGLGQRVPEEHVARPAVARAAP